MKRADWPRNDVDRFILARLETAGLSPVPEADRWTLARRLTFALTGLPPRFEDVQKFVNDSSPNAYENLLDELMKSPQFGECWRGIGWISSITPTRTDTNGTFRPRTAGDIAIT